MDRGARRQRGGLDPWHARRAAIAIADGHVAIDWRDRLPKRPASDLLQAGPLLVREGASAIAGEDDPEGFSTTSEEFDEDIPRTVNRGSPSLSRPRHCSWWRRTDALPRTPD
jgi:hypothetical protein